jgi:hypothetical protein
MTLHRDAVERILTLHKACPEALVWSRDHATLEAAWEALDNAEWMLWALHTFGYQGERKLRLFAASCALRSRAFWPDPQCDAAIQAATNATPGPAGKDALAAAYLATKAAAAKIVDRSDYSLSMAHAAGAAQSALRLDAMQAAKDASCESARAIASDPKAPRPPAEELAWQATELRRIVGPDITPLIAAVRKSTRGALHVL